MGRHQKGYLPVPRLDKEHGQKLEYKCHIIIHVNFDHAWGEHYPVTITLRGWARKEQISKTSQFK